MRRLLPLLLLISTASCTTIKNFLSTPVEVNHPRVLTPAGAEYEEIIEGLGPVAELEDEVLIDYTGRFEDRSVFDSSVDRGQPYLFTIGAAPLLGWDEGVLGMRAGGSRMLYLPPELAYGEEGIPGLVPPNTPLIFRIDLIEVLGKTD